MRLPPALSGVAFVAAACATAPPPGDPIVNLRATAASDLSCPAELLRIAPMGDATFGDTRQPLYQEVQGCSMHVVYVATKQGYVLSSPKQRPPHGPDHVDVR